MIYGCVCMSKKCHINFGTFDAYETHSHTHKTMFFVVVSLMCSLFWFEKMAKIRSQVALKQASTRVNLKILKNFSNFLSMFSCQKGFILKQGNSIREVWIGLLSNIVNFITYDLLE